MCMCFKILPQACAQSQHLTVIISSLMFFLLFLNYLSCEDSVVRRQCFVIKGDMLKYYYVCLMSH